ncbi:MAG: lytic transglycosylase domain-containing protein [Chitinophagaceae bacterium]|nr:lytic transglycosylase domain-containing protein [Chitinophagaceae bacterium]
MLKKKLWRMSFFCQGAYLIIAASNGNNLLQQDHKKITCEQYADTIDSDDFINISPVKLNSRAEKFVASYIQNNKESLQLSKERGLLHFAMMDSVFSSYGLPIELKYLSVVESELNGNAVSHVGAVGPWQLMPETARILGLRVSGKVDERKYFKKSTVAAAKYVKDLYCQFGDWLLVIAAYNGGPAPVYKAIKKSGSRNFWKLQNFLPAETRGHVKRYIATHYFFEGQGSITTMTKTEMNTYLKMIDELYAKKAIRDKTPVDTLQSTANRKEISSSLLLIKSR